MTEWLLLTSLVVGQATGHAGPAGPGQVSSARPPELNGAGVEQRLGRAVPAEVPFKNHDGRDVTLPVGKIPPGFLGGLFAKHVTLDERVSVYAIFDR